MLPDDMQAVEIEGKLYVSCGCVSYREGDAFIIKACDDPNCPFVHLAHKMSVERGNPVEHWRVEDYQKKKRDEIETQR
jgi:hypothetical protein